MGKLDRDRTSEGTKRKRKKLKWALSLSLILVVISLVSTLIVLHQNAPMQDLGLGFDIASAQKLASETSFPKDEAGLSAYINLGHLDFDKLKTVSESTFSDILDTDGGSYIYGVIPVSGNVYCASWTDNVYFYADINGWLVAFFPNNTPSASLAFWTDGDWHRSILSNDNTLEQALKQFMDQLGIDLDPIKSSIKYYHFSYPQATDLTLFVAYGDKEVSFFIPEEITLYETSYNLLDNDNNGYLSSIELRDRVIASIDSSRKLGIIKEEPIESTKKLKKPGGLAVGKTFNVTVKYYPILDRDGDGKVTTEDIEVDTPSVAVVAVYPRDGVVTLEVKTYSTADMPVELTYTGSELIPVYPSSRLYKLVSSDESSWDLSVAMVLVYS